jgi:hypothetical protein
MSTTHITIPSFINEMPISSLNDVDKLLIAADYTLIDGRCNAGLIGQAIFRISKSLSGISLPYLESRFRFFVSNTYLIAAPLVDVPKGLVALSLTSTEHTKYFLWVCVNGKGEASRTLKRYHTTSEENAERLAETGFLFSHESFRTPKGSHQQSATQPPTAAT